MTKFQRAHELLHNLGVETFDLLFINFSHFAATRLVRARRTFKQGPLPLMGDPPKRRASSEIVSSPFSAPKTSLALNVGLCGFRIDTSDLLRCEDQETENSILR